jgi:hypothetical protein
MKKMIASAILMTMTLATPAVAQTTNGPQLNFTPEVASNIAFLWFTDAAWVHFSVEKHRMDMVVHSCMRLNMNIQLFDLTDEQGVVVVEYLKKAQALQPVMDAMEICSSVKEKQT